MIKPRLVYDSLLETWYYAIDSFAFIVNEASESEFAYFMDFRMFINLRN